MTPPIGHEWWMCACERALPAHVDAAPDPAGGAGCGMAWRICEASTEIEERHITDITDSADIGVQPGGHLRQDVPAGPALPNHPAERTRRNRMVSRHPEAVFLRALADHLDAHEVPGVVVHWRSDDTDPDHGVDLQLLWGDARADLAAWARSLNAPQVTVKHVISGRVYLGFDADISGWPVEVWGTTDQVAAQPGTEISVDQLHGAGGDAR